MELMDKDKRDGYIYDVVIKQNDSEFWKATTGSLSVASNKLRFTSASASSFGLHLYADVEFGLNVPTTPSAGEAKTWGLRNPSVDIGAAYFEITGATFRVVTIDDEGTSETTTVTWSSYEATETKFRLIWEPDKVHFLIDGTVVATHTVRVPQAPLALRITNADADNTDLGYVMVRRAAAII